MKKKAFGYLRVSDPSQVEGDGLTRQELAIRKYADAHGLTIVGFYREEGISGMLEDRPMLARLMVDLEQNGHGVRTVVIEKLDRLARDLMVQEAIVRDLLKQGFELVSTMEGPDLASADPTRKLIRQIMGAVAEYDRAMLVLKLRVARERKKIKTGRCEGRLPYGKDDKEQEVIKKVKLLRRDRKGGFKGATLEHIATTLNAAGFTTRTGKAFTPTQIHNILKK
jgi:DNA invertase Pin-like site-specific DNA recombinase